MSLLSIYHILRSFNNIQLSMLCSSQLKVCTVELVGMLAFHWGEGNWLGSRCVGKEHNGIIKASSMPCCGNEFLEVDI